MTVDRRFARHFLLAAAALGCLYLAGRGRLAPPPLAHPSRLPAWWKGEGPVVAVFSATRLALLIAGLYWLILLGMVGAVGVFSPRRLMRSAPGRRLVGARRAVRLALGASALGSALAGGATPVFAAPAPAASSTGPGPAPTITNLAGLGGPLAAKTPLQAVPPGTAQPGPSGTVTRPGSTATGAPPAPGLGPAPAPATRAGPPPTPTTTTGPEPASTSAPTGAPAPTASAPTSNGPVDTAPSSPPADTLVSTSPAHTARGSTPAPIDAGASGGGEAAASQWIVGQGDNLWFIAEQTLAAAWGRSPSDRQVGRYWIRVIDANRSRLPDPSDPSLLFAGDVIFLPPVPPG